MAEQWITKYQLSVGLDGPDSKTITRILAGKPVRPYSLYKLAKALRVPREQIPDE